VEVERRLVEYLRKSHRWMKEWMLMYEGRVRRMYPPHLLHFYSAPHPSELDDHELMREVEALREIWDVESRDDTNQRIYIYVDEYERIRYDPYLGFY